MHLPGHDAKVLAIMEGHDIEEAMLLHAVVEYEPELLRRFQGTRLPDDLRQARTFGQGERLDDDAIRHAALTILLVGFGNIELAARAAAPQGADDGIAIELSGASSGLVGSGSAGHRFGYTLFNPFQESVQQDQPERALQGQPVETCDADAAFALDGFGEMPGRRPSPDDDIEHGQWDQGDDGEDGADKTKYIADHAADELEDMNHEPADALEHRTDQPADPLQDRNQHENDYQYAEGYGEAGYDRYCYGCHRLSLLTSAPGDTVM